MGNGGVMGSGTANFNEELAGTFAITMKVACEYAPFAIVIFSPDDHDARAVTENDGYITSFLGKIEAAGMNLAAGDQYGFEVSATNEFIRDGKGINKTGALITDINYSTPAKSKPVLQ